METEDWRDMMKSCALMARWVICTWGRRIGYSLCYHGNGTAGGVAGRVIRDESHRSERYRTELRRMKCHQPLSPLIPFQLSQHKLTFNWLMW